MKYHVTVGEEVFTIEVNEAGQLSFDGEIVDVDFATSGSTGLYSLLVNNESFESLVELRDGVYRVLLRGNMYDVAVMDERDMLISARASSLISDSGEMQITAPMPGMVVSVPVEVGQKIEKGNNLLILEFDENGERIKAPRDCTVMHIRVEAGESVEQNQVMLVLG